MSIPGGILNSRERIYHFQSRTFMLPWEPMNGGET